MDRLVRLRTDICTYLVRETTWIFLFFLQVTYAFITICCLSYLLLLAALKFPCSDLSQPPYICQVR